MTCSSEHVAEVIAAALSAPRQLGQPFGCRTLDRLETYLNYPIIDNSNTHRASDVLLFSLQHPRWEFVFQPKYAAYLNLIEPWWKVLRSPALKGRRFGT